MVRRIALALAAVTVLGGESMAQPAVLALPQIVIAPEESMLAISGRVSGLDTGEVTATLRIEKSDSGGSMNTSQSRDIAVTPGSSDIIASTRLSAQAGLVLNVTLTLLSEGITIATATTSLGTAPD